jgi:hypothetical protein
MKYLYALAPTILLLTSGFTTKAPIENKPTEIDAKNIFSTNISPTKNSIVCSLLIDEQNSKHSGLSNISIIIKDKNNKPPISLQLITSGVDKVSSSLLVVKDMNTKEESYIEIAKVPAPQKKLFLGLTYLNNGYFFAGWQSDDQEQGSTSFKIDHIDPGAAEVVAAGITPGGACMNISSQ